MKEAQTGSFSAGAGFSSADSLLFNVRIQENNLFGRGQRLVAERRHRLHPAQHHPVVHRAVLPRHAADRRLRRLQLAARASTTSIARGTGGSVHVHLPGDRLRAANSLWGIPLEDVRIGVDYRIEHAKINDVGFNAPVDIREAEGTSIISSITPRISRNTLNHYFDPTAGSVQDLSVEIAGLGGEQLHQGRRARTRWYYTFLQLEDVRRLHLLARAPRSAYGVGNEGVDGNELPLFERYFPGGINSIRGFEPRTLGPRAVPQEHARHRRSPTTPVGGSSQLILNNEIIFPIVQGIGLKGVVFFDAGNAYGGDENDVIDDARYAAGGGVRWLSPLGPLRVELGVPVQHQAARPEAADPLLVRRAVPVLNVE